MHTEDELITNPVADLSLGEGTCVRVAVVDETIPGGAGLLFEEDPHLVVNTMVTVWFRQKPTRAQVKYVLKQEELYRVGVQWCGEKRNKPRPYGSI